MAGVLGLYVLYMSALASLNHDELEAVHTAWKTVQGEVIYADFFQHHHPLFYAWLAPVIMLSGERAATVVACRIATLPFFAGIIAAAWMLARRLFDKRTALVAAACLLLSWPFLYEATEIRPERPAGHARDVCAGDALSAKGRAGGRGAGNRSDWQSCTHHAPP